MLNQQVDIREERGDTQEAVISKNGGTKKSRKDHASDRDQDGEFFGCH
jgi:hypothetical protein